MSKGMNGEITTDSGKLSEYFFLRKGEKARQPYAFPPPGNPCPHCGHFDAVHTKTYFGCTFCGTYLYNEVFQPALPLTQEMLDEDGYYHKMCSCGSQYKTRDQFMDVCYACRARASRKKYRDSHKKEVCHEIP